MVDADRRYLYPEANSMIQLLNIGNGNTSPSLFAWVRVMAAMSGRFHFSSHASSLLINCKNPPACISSSLASFMIDVDELTRFHIQLVTYYILFYTAALF